MLGGGLFSNKPVAAPTNPNKDFEVTQPPDDTISAMAFSPAAMQQNFLIAGSWDNSVRCVDKHRMMLQSEVFFFKF